MWETVKTWVGLEEKKLFFDEETSSKSKVPEIKIPENPAKFIFNQEKPKLEGLKSVQADMGQKIDKAIKAYVTIDQVSADASYLPVLADVQGDQKEIIINSAINGLR